jgi:uncharacterized protein YjiS (DUF1127 family)
MSYASYARQKVQESQKVPFAEFVEPTRFVGETFYGASEAIAHAAARVFKEAVVKSRRRASEKELSALSDHTLKDIGVHRSEIHYLTRRVAENADAGNRALRS